MPKKGDKGLGNMTSSALYNGMINPVLGYTMKGCIWYQGETNRKTPDLYRKLFKSMLADWRKRWNIFGRTYIQVLQDRGGKMILCFDNASNGLSTYGKPVTSFMIAGDDRVFYPAKAQIRNKEIIVYSEQVANPVAVRYAFTDYAVGCLYNVEGCCASSFRTDNWDDNTCKFNE